MRPRPGAEPDWDRAGQQWTICPVCGRASGPASGAAVAIVTILSQNRIVSHQRFDVWGYGSDGVQHNLRRFCVNLFISA